MKSSYLISVVVPLYNDSPIIEIFVAEIIQILQNNYVNYELVLVNDGSEDDTTKKVIELLKRYECIRLLNLSRHFGTEIAISSGLDSVIGDFVVVMLPETDPPQLIPELINLCSRSNDILIGVRKNRAGEPIWMKMGANIFYWCCKHIFKIPFTKNATQFRVLNRTVVNALIQVEDKYRYLRLISTYIGYRSQTFIYEPLRRYKRPKSRRLVESISLGLNIIFVNSVNPLRLASLLSCFASIIIFLYLIYILIIYIFKDKVIEGWVSLSVQNAVMFLFISLVLAVLCEYIGLMFTKTRGWAAYYITDEKTSSVLIADRERRNVVQESKNIKL